MSRRLIRHLCVLSCAALAATGLVACGGSGSDAEDPSSLATKNANDALEFSRCMRAHGVHIETSTSGENVRVGGGGNITPRTMEAAQNACAKYSPFQKAKLTPAERVAREEQVQKFAKCLREHGVKVEASTANGNFAVKIGGPPPAGSGGSESGPSAPSPAFQKAQESCQGLLPVAKGARAGTFAHLPKGGPGQKAGFALRLGG